MSEQAEVPVGHFTDVLLTKDFTPLHPKVLEYKLYARASGPCSSSACRAAPGRRSSSASSRIVVLETR